MVLFQSNEVTEIHHRHNLQKLIPENDMQFTNLVSIKTITAAGISAFLRLLIMCGDKSTSFLNNGYIPGDLNGLHF